MCCSQQIFVGQRGSGDHPSNRRVLTNSLKLSLNYFEPLIASEVVGIENEGREISRS